MTSLMSAVVLLGVGVADPTSEDIVQTRLRDATFTLKVLKADFSELAKIKPDYSQQYRFQSTQVFVKEPFKMRIESRVDDTLVQYIVTDTARYWRIPRAGISTKEDISAQPGKRQTWLESGLLTPSMVGGFLRATFVRVDRASGNYVFDLTYPLNNFDDKSRHRIWVDPGKRYITKREWYNQHKRQLATFFYEKPISRDSIWFPTRIVLKNVDNKIAAISEAQGVKLNTGLSDDLFK